MTLPEPIRTALGIRNGGSVRNTSIDVLPLDQIVPVDDDFWRRTEIDEDEAPDHALMFVFGHENEVGGTFLMNFNADGPGARRASTSTITARAPTSSPTRSASFSNRRSPPRPSRR